MRMKDFVINIGNIEKGIKKVFKESLYKCDELDRASINGVITALYLQKPLSVITNSFEYSEDAALIELAFRKDILTLVFSLVKTYSLLIPKEYDFWGFMRVVLFSILSTSSNEGSIELTLDSPLNNFIS